MELTLEQALQKGIEAHKAGQVQEADRYYTAILKAQPKHSDANHNMGVLAVGVGKVEEAIPFFKTALEANLSTAQYWLSYIDALIKLDRMADAKAVLDQAKSKGAKGDGFDRLEEQLKTSSVEVKNQTQEDSLNQSNILDQLKLDEAIKLAKKRIRDGLSEEAKKIYQDILQEFPKNNKAIIGLKKLSGQIHSSAKNPLDPPQAQLQKLMNLYGQGLLQTALDQSQALSQAYPNSAILLNIKGALLKGLGNLNLSVADYKKAVSIKPDYADAYCNMGNALQDQGKMHEAIEAYNKALSIKSDYAEVYNNIGLALNEQGKSEEAIDAYKKAVSIKPDYADAYNNMGNALQENGKSEEAIEAYTKALSIKQDYAEVYSNMGNALKKQGKLEEAVKAHNKSLSIKPDYANAYNNMGVALQDQGKMDEAIEAYDKAIYIRPDYSEAYWNLSGTADGTSKAKNWVKKCLEADPNHLEAKLTLSALHFYEGNKGEFNSLIESSLKDHPYIRSLAWVFNLPKLPPLHFHRWAFFDHMVDLSKKDRPFYEFGVWRGEAFRYLIKTFKKGYGFDTFEGLPEDWHNEKAGTYTSDGNIPKIKGGKFIAGKFGDTLPGFFAEVRPMASIINFDADLYSSTICALNHAKPVIDKHTILIFDEFIINKNWEQDEYKALEEFCATNHYTYEVLAISFFTKQAAVKIIGI